MSKHNGNFIILNLKLVNDSSIHQDGEAQCLKGEIKCSVLSCLYVIQLEISQLIPSLHVCLSSTAASLKSLK